MAADTAHRQELDALRRRVAALEAEHADMAARANAAVAAAQDRAYWLDRYHIDLNAIMRRRAAQALVTVLKPARRAAGRVRRTLG